MGRRVLDTLEDLEAFSRLLAGLELPLTISWRQGRDRSSEQNALQWKWAGEAAQQIGETPEDIQAEWKLQLGVPILRAEDDDFREEYDDLFKPLPYRTKLRLIRLMDWPVSRRMTVRQMTRYLDAINGHCGGMGVVLTQPEDSLSRYMDGHRRAA